MKVRIATINDLELLKNSILELRPHLEVATLDKKYQKQENEGYTLIFIGDEKAAYAILGFRTLNIFFSGKTLYIDDLITLPEYRGNGYGGLLLDWIKNYAKENDYDHLSLDSEFQRKTAHRLYLNKGLQVSSLHFGRQVKDL